MKMYAPSFILILFILQTERHFIMQVVCEATQSSDVKVKVAALQCLVRIMSLYYQYMETYMGPALFAITLEAMKSEIDEVALQGIDFSCLFTKVNSLFTIVNN